MCGAAKPAAELAGIGGRGHAGAALPLRQRPLRRGCCRRMGQLLSQLQQACHGSAAEAWPAPNGRLGPSGGSSDAADATRARRRGCHSRAAAAAAIRPAARLAAAAPIARDGRQRLQTDPKGLQQLVEQVGKHSRVPLPQLLRHLRAADAPAAGALRDGGSCQGRRGTPAREVCRTLPARCTTARHCGFVLPCRRRGGGLQVRCARHIAPAPDYGH